MVTDLNEANFNKEISGVVPIIVDFWASWCMPCRMMAPVFEELSSEYAGDELRFGKLSTETFPDIASQNAISSIPCLIIFKQGKEIDRIVGFGPKEFLKEKIERILGN